VVRILSLVTGLVAHPWAFRQSTPVALQILTGIDVDHLNLLRDKHIEHYRMLVLKCTAASFVSIRCLGCLSLPIVETYP